MKGLHINRTAILLEAFNSMPDTFTSYEFNDAAIAKGYPERLLEQKGLSAFIKKYAVNEGRYSKSWTKKSALEQDEDNTISKLQECIDYLKANGYKIMKPAQTWEEV